jgi:EAL domain-containing protein (putative c-di-GMP-specific phosphodiesterase class I)
VAEGVDSLGQARRIRELGCDEIQGFLVSEAVTAEELERFRRNWRGIFPVDLGSLHPVPD